MEMWFGAVPGHRRVERVQFMYAGGRDVWRATVRLGERKKLGKR